MANASISDLTDFYEEIPDGVIRRSDLIAAGVPNSSLAARCRPGGPWQRLLPGVLLLANSPPSRRQRLRAALLYAGPDSMITGTEALRAHGMAAPDRSQVHVLIPSQRRTSGRGYVQVERTKRLPKPVSYNGLRFAPACRAAADAARHLPEAGMQRMMLLAPIHAGVRTVDEIRAELDAGSQRGTAALRALLDDVGPPPLTSTVQQGWARRVIRRAPLPPPTWNVPVFGKLGRQLGVADAWWDEIALAWDFGNQRDGRTSTRRDAFAAAGVVMIRTALPELRGDPDAVVQELTSAFLKAAGRTRPPVRARL